MTYFIVPLHMLAVLICILFIAWRFRISLVEALPVFVCGLALTLYVLAFLHRLSWIDAIALLTVVLFSGWLAGRRKEERARFICVCRQNITQPSFIIAVLLLAVVAVCTSAKPVTWWDDFNFWAVDARALYFSDGFAGKYGNVASAFGDYPPGSQLIKWWFLHLSPQEFREGLAFVGYYTMNLVFLLPLLKKWRGKNVFFMALMAAALWLFPGIGEYFGYYGFCADLTMACIYGGFLYAVTDRETASEAFYYGRMALYLGVLVIVKSIGFVWALFGLVFFVLYRYFVEGRTRREDGGTTLENGRRRGVRGGLAAVVLLPAMTGGSWMLFCLLMRRVANSTTTAVKYIVTDEYGLSGYMGEYAAAFVRAFFGSPLHRTKSFFINMTPIGCYLAICLLCLLFWKSKLLSAKFGKMILAFCTISGALFYGIIFLAHITIFAGEIQYLETSGMILSIERYGAPFTIGTLLFLAQIWLDNGGKLFDNEKMPRWLQQYGAPLCFILFVALTANYQIGYDGLIGYRDDMEEHWLEREAYIDDQAEEFLEAIRILESENTARVYYFRGNDTPEMHDIYTSYLASPVSVVHKEIDLDGADADWVLGQIRGSHASYLYVEETDADENAVFDAVTQEESFFCGALYRIEDDGQSIKLTRVSQ